MAYDPVSGEFIGRHSHFLEDVLHDRAKQMVMAFGALAIIGFAASFKVERLIPWRRELGCLVLSMALSTAFVTPVKVVTSVQCPWSLKEFGGEETYSELLSPRPATEKPGRCWPGGHAATWLYPVCTVFCAAGSSSTAGKSGAGTGLRSGIDIFRRPHAARCALLFP